MVKEGGVQSILGKTKLWRKVDLRPRANSPAIEAREWNIRGFLEENADEEGARVIVVAGLR